MHAKARKIQNLDEFAADGWHKTINIYTEGLFCGGT